MPPTIVAMAAVQELAEGAERRARDGAASPIVRDAVAIGLATGAYGVSFGVLALAAGLSQAQACAMSLLVFTGASQFAVVGVVGAGGGMVAALAPALLLAARNAVYGLALVPILRGRRARRALEAQLVIDESTAMARAQDDPLEAHRAFLATGVSVFVFWNLGTLAGALVGTGLGDPRDLGLDAMFPAAFLALLAPQLRRPGAPTAAAAGALLAFALLPVAPAGVPILAAVLGVVPAVLVARRAVARTTT
jgi:4-azaleucine resistance transporter AzlC